MSPSTGMALDDGVGGPGGLRATGDDPGVNPGGCEEDPVTGDAPPAAGLSPGMPGTGMEPNLLGSGEVAVLSR
eukprot:CAMPEP_0204492120 /NCGR_PEP_ID=MMETSP0471-20130131/78946_1 /ASSEMBLY_ACC=CAM_ASM_000602 /TAXON_ID=2969 /ORGANISM="Oxyrrhis marina" /LENGTH=72 /DNA_ID=CAMNT_0051496165 /DNA_START=112 /DNA_END=330 /DNA_ORIENTATION=+